MAPELSAHRIQALADADMSGNPPVDNYELDGYALDMFALGLVAYHVLTLRYPFPTLMTAEEFSQEVQRDELSQLVRLGASHREWQVGPFTFCSGSHKHDSRAWFKL